jgi:hypothetical protein
MNHEINRGIPYRPRPAAQSTRANKESPAPTSTDVERFLRLPPKIQGEILGRVRSHQASAIEQVEFVYRTSAFAELIREELEILEDNPAAFADFQAAFIKAVVDLTDESTVSRIHELLEAACAQAAAHGLQASARPKDPDQLEAWALRRDALDRPVTRRVEALLNPEQRVRFGRAFLGVIGIDLGRGDGARHRFVTDAGVVFPSDRV